MAGIPDATAPTREQRSRYEIGNNACSGQLSSDNNADGNFQPAGTSEVFFTTMMIV